MVILTVILILLLISISIIALSGSVYIAVLLYYEIKDILDDRR